MKKLVLALITMMLVLSGCSAASSADYKVGSGSVTSIKPTEATADKEGSVQFNTTIATVLLDGDKIKDVKIDVAQNTVKFDTTGKVAVPTDTPSKQEKGDAYGMKGNSEIGKEWYEQIAALEDWMIGKTLEEVKAMKTFKRDDAHPAVPDEEDLKSSVTIDVSGYLAAVEKAVELAVAVDGDVAELGAANTTALTGEDAGKIQANTEIAHVALDKDGKVLAAFVDVAQNSVKITAEGKFDGEVKAIDSKYVRGEGYGMKGASGIGKEWFEQADAYVAFVTGMKADEASALAIDDKGYFADADLVASVTVHAGTLQANFAKAIEQVTEVK